MWNPNDGWDWLWKWSDPDNTPLHPDHTTPLDPYGPGAGFHKPFHDLPLLKKYKDWPVWFKPFEVWGGGGSGVDDRPYGRLGFGYKFGRLRIYGWGEGGVDDAGFPGMTGGGIGVGIQWNVEPIFMRTR